MNLFKMLMMAAFSIMTFTTFSQEKAGRKDTTNHPAFYTCPKHSDVKSEKAGNCSICGMKLELTPKEKMKREVTKSYTCPIHTDVLLKEPGKCPQCGKDLSLSPKEKMKMEVVKKYTCSMHSDVTSKTPGKCSICNMDLVETKKEKHSEHH
jgi:transcription initiation factor IIE alpha subunit